MGVSQDLSCSGLSLDVGHMCPVRHSAARYPGRSGPETACNDRLHQRHPRRRDPQEPRRMDIKLQIEKRTDVSNPEGPNYGADSRIRIANINPTAAGSLQFGAGRPRRLVKMTRKG